MRSGAQKFVAAVGERVSKIFERFLLRVWGWEVRALADVEEGHACLCGLGGSVCTLRPFLSHNNRELILFPRARWPIHHTCLSLRHLITQVRAYPHTVRASVRLPILAPTDYTTASSASASSASTSDERPPRAAIRENSERVSASASASLHVSPPSAARQAS